MNKTEIALLENIYLGKEALKSLIEETEMDEMKISDLINEIEEKSSCPSCFSTIRKAFKIGYLNKDKYCPLNMDKEIEKYSEIILRIKPNMDTNAEITKLKIYNILVNYYNNYEYSYLIPEKSR